MWYINLVCFFSTKNNENNENPFWAWCGKIRPLVLNSPWLLCWDRPAAARHCACFNTFSLQCDWTVALEAFSFPLAGDYLYMYILLFIYLFIYLFNDYWLQSSNVSSYWLLMPLCRIVRSYSVVNYYCQGNSQRLGWGKDSLFQLFNEWNWSDVVVRNL